MNKQTIITILLALVAMMAQAQAFHYRIVGNIGCEYTGWLYLIARPRRNDGTGTSLSLSYRW